MTTTITGYKPVDSRHKSMYSEAGEPDGLYFALGEVVTAAGPFDATPFDQGFFETRKVGETSGGFYVYSFRLGQWHTANGAADIHRGTDGYAMILEYESPDDVVYHGHAAGDNCTEDWLTTATVVGVYSPATPVSSSTASSMQIAVAIGAADASVTYSVANPGGTVIAVGTATHGSAGTYSFTLGAQSDPGRYPVTWSGTWSGNARNFYTYGRK